MRIRSIASTGGAIHMTTTTLHPYLNFDGKTEDAMKFYAEVLGGKLEVMRFGDTPPGAGPPVPPDYKNKVMHATLKSGDMVLMASDTMPNQGTKVGDNVSLSLNFTDAKEQQRVWDKISQGAKVTMPLGDQFFGKFGMLTDRFGVHWMLHFGPPQQGK